MATFVCPLCKTSGRWGTGTRDDGSVFLHCNGSLREPLPGGGELVRTCPWQCEPHQALEFGLATTREEILQVAHRGSVVSTKLGAHASDASSGLLGDAAEELEKLADKLRLIRSYVIEQEQKREASNGQ